MRRNEFKFVLLIPILHVLASLTTNYYPAGTLNPGTIRALIVMPFAMFFIVKRYPKTKLNLQILLFLIYLLVLVFFSSNVKNGLYIYSKIFLSFIMFPIGYFYVNSFERYKKLHHLFVIIMFILFANMVISNIFNLGTSDYLEDSIYFGAGRVNITKSIAVLVLISPLTLKFIKRKWRKYYVILIALSIGVVLLGIKRSALLSLAVGFFVYFVFSPQKKRNIKLIISFTFLLFIGSLYFADTFYDRLSARSEHVVFLEFDLEDGFNEKIGRQAEVMTVINDFSNRNILEIIFGVELFNEFKYYNVQRMLHTDYMILLHGAGILGLLWYFYLIIKILAVNLKRKNTNSLIILRENNSIIFALLTASLFLSYAGSLYSIDLRTTMMLFLGATTRMNIVFSNSSLYFKHN